MRQLAIFQKCEGCGKRALIIKHRTFKIGPINAPVTSKKLLCGTCAKHIATMI